MSKTSKFIVPLHVNYAYLKCFHLNHHYPGLIPANQQYLKTNLFQCIFVTISKYIHLYSRRQNYFAPLPPPSNL